ERRCDVEFRSGNRSADTGSVSGKSSSVEPVIEFRVEISADWISAGELHALPGGGAGIQFLRPATGKKARGAVPRTDRSPADGAGHGDRILRGRTRGERHHAFAHSDLGDGDAGAFVCRVAASYARLRRVGGQ